MPLQMFKEQFDGKYDGVTPAVLLPQGWISDGKNMRKVSLRGGWKPRKGCTLFNTTALESGADVLSLHCYKHPRNADYHFLAQVNSKLVDSPQDPPTAAAGTAWTTIESSNVHATTAGFSDVVNEEFFYADGASRPLMWGGDTPFCTGFIVYDGSADVYNDYTRYVRDENDSTEAIVLGTASDNFYVCAPCRAEGLILDFGTTVNTAASTLQIQAWRTSSGAGTWVSVSSMADGTASSGATLSVDGTITWTRSTDDLLRVVSGITGYWYKFGWSNALTGSVDVISAQVQYDMAPLDNKWDGNPEWVTGCKLYDNSAEQYKEYLGKVSNESTSAYADLGSVTETDVLYFKTVEPATGIGVGVVPDYENTNAQTISALKYWDGDSWESVTGLDDETEENSKTLAKTGWIWWDASQITPYRRELEGDPLAGYWYQIIFTGDLSSDVRAYLMTYAPFPEELPKYDGCIEFKGRLFLWGDPEYPNRLRYSVQGRPDCFSGTDSGWTDPFGNMSKITCARRFYNELIVWKEDSVWLLEGNTPSNFGRLKIADTVGLASPHTAHVVETGYPAMHRDETLSIAIWQDVDGVYVLDGRKPKKVSLPIDHYFNPEYSSTVIAATSIKSLSAYVDKINNEYHLLLPSAELVYNVVSDEWYPPWEREQDLLCGISFKGADNRDYTYGGDTDGFIHRLENDTTDKTTSNTDTTITHNIKTRAISANPEQSTTLLFTFRRIQCEFKARSSGSVTTTVFSDVDQTGAASATPSAMSLVNSGKDLAVPYLDESVEGALTIQAKFEVATADVEMEIYSWLYELGLRGSKAVV